MSEHLVHCDNTLEERVTLGARGHLERTMGCEVVGGRREGSVEREGDVGHLHMGGKVGWGLLGPLVDDAVGVGREVGAVVHGGGRGGGSDEEGWWRGVVGGQASVILCVWARVVKAL